MITRLRKWNNRRKEIRIARKLGIFTFPNATHKYIGASNEYGLVSGMPCRIVRGSKAAGGMGRKIRRIVNSQGQQYIVAGDELEPLDLIKRKTR